MNPNDANAADTFAAIDTTGCPASALGINPTVNVSLTGGQTQIASTLTISVYPPIGTPGRTLTFDGSSVTIHGQNLAPNVGGDYIGETLINGSNNNHANTVTIDNSISLVSSPISNFGILTLTGPGIMTLASSAVTNQVGGFFYTTGLGLIAGPGFAGPTSSIVNNGTMVVQPGPQGASTQTVITVNDFTNTGLLLINSAILRISTALTRPTQQGVNASTSLQNGGQLIIGGGAGTYFLLGGSISGNGTIKGTVADVQPGVAPGPNPRQIVPTGGLLKIQGDLTLSRNTTLLCKVSQGSANQISVSGTFSTNGCFYAVRRAAGYTPPLGTSILFVSAGICAGGDLDNVRAAGNAWNDANAVPASFAARATDQGIILGRGSRITRISLEVIRRARAGAALANPGNPILLAAFQNDPAFIAPLFVTSVNGSTTKVGTAITTALGGSFMALSDGSYDYVPPASTFGDDSVQYTVSDGYTTKTATITLPDPNPAPAVTNTAYTLRVYPECYAAFFIGLAL